MCSRPCPCTAAYTVADKAQVYDEIGADNPSLPLGAVLERLSGNGVLLALAPGDNTDTLYSQVEGLRDYILAQTNQSYKDIIYLFDSESDLEDYITDRDYDDDGYMAGKIAMAIVLTVADVDNKNWDYSVRTNFSYEWEQNQASVACLYGNPADCEFTYAIPSTQYYSQDLLKPQDSSYLYGYTYSAFSTLQLTVDQYILSVYGFNVKIMASIGYLIFVL